MQKLILLTLTFVLLLPAAGKKLQRSWKTGRVLDSSTTERTYATGAVTNSTGTATATGSATTVGPTTTGSATATGSSTSTTTIQHVTVQSNELLILGIDYLYVIRDERRKGGPILATALHNRHHGCRFIVGEDVKYAQEKGDLYVIDADGKECKTPILRQQKKDVDPGK